MSPLTCLRANEFELDLLDELFKLYIERSEDQDGERFNSGRTRWAYTRNIKLGH